MNERSNGIDAAPASALSDAIQQHAAALLRANTNPNGMMAINPAQMFCDLELATLRIEILFEALVDAGIISPGALVAKLTAKLLAEAEHLNAPAPQIEIIRGTVPRNG